MCSNEGRNTKKNQDKYMDSWSAGTDKWDRPTVPSKIQCTKRRLGP